MEKIIFFTGIQLQLKRDGHAQNIFRCLERPGRKFSPREIVSTEVVDSTISTSISAFVSNTIVEVYDVRIFEKQYGTSASEPWKASKFLALLSKAHGSENSFG